MNAKRELAADNQRRSRSSTATVSMLAAGLMLLLSMVGHALLAAPDAAATPALTNQDIAYVQLLEQAGTVPAPGYTYYELSLSGRIIANDVRRGVQPLVIANQVYYNTDLTWYQAKYEVAAAVVVYAPELLPPSIDASEPGLVA